MEENKEEMSNPIDAPAQGASIAGESPGTEPLWTVEELARYLRFEEETIRAMAREGKLPAFKIGRTWRFKQEQIQEWIGQSSQRD